MTRSGSNPRRTCCSRTKLCNSSAAPTSSIVASAVCANTRVCRANIRDVPAVPLPCWASSGVSAARDARHAGMSPTIRPLTSDAKRPAASTGASRAISSVRGSVGGNTPPLSHELTNQSRSPRAQRRAQRQLVLTGEVPGQQHAGDVRTGNEQDQRHRGEKRQQGGTYAGVEHRVGNPVDLNAPSFVRGWKLLLEGSGDALHLVLCLVDRDIRPKPPDHANGMVAAVLTRRIDRERDEHLRRGCRGEDRSPDVAKRRR